MFGPTYARHGHRLFEEMTQDNLRELLRIALKNHVVPITKILSIVREKDKH